MIAAARLLFANQGYAETSMAQVAQSAGVSTGALYHHWSTKTDLLSAVVSELHREIATEILRSTVRSESTHRRLNKAAQTFLRRCEDRDVARILLVEGPAVLGARWEELDRRWWLTPTEKLLREATTTGHLTTKDPRLLAAALLGSLTALGRQVADHDSAVHGAALQAFQSITDSLFHADES